MSQKVCAIAGFGAGVSTGVAKAFGNEGYTLALLARNPGRLAENAQDLQQAGYTVQTFTADAGEQDSLVHAFAQIRSQLEDPEILIYNAAASTAGKPTTISFDQLIADFRVNVAGALVAAQQVIPAMKAKGRGTILFTGGGLALHPWADASSLAIGKAGIRSLAFSLAQELTGTGIHVGTVTICGTVQSGTHFDPETIAQSYLALHKQPPEAFEIELVYE